MDIFGDKQALDPDHGEKYAALMIVLGMAFKLWRIEDEHLVRPAGPWQVKRAGVLTIDRK
jgi:hypothetical protein